jgi:hypothetical protein
MRVELSMEARDVDADCLRADEEPGCDFAVREALVKKREHLEFAGRWLVAIDLPTSGWLGGHPCAATEVVGKGAQWSRAKQ